ncbi:MAG: hypothetical protein JXR96_04880 [Deltaproteobacteria bacterium]|nr:hypothetical protein [Deltaproteobacteria bacterium]
MTTDPQQLAARVEALEHEQAQDRRAVLQGASESLRIASMLAALAARAPVLRLELVAVAGCAWRLADSLSGLGLGRLGSGQGAEQDPCAIPGPTPSPEIPSQSGFSSGETAPALPSRAQQAAAELAALAAEVDARADAVAAGLGLESTS